MRTIALNAQHVADDPAIDAVMKSNPDEPRKKLPEKRH